MGVCVAEETSFLFYTFWNTSKFLSEAVVTFISKSVNTHTHTHPTGKETISFWSETGDGKVN